MEGSETLGGMRSDPVLELARRGAVRLAVFGGAALSLASLTQILLGDSTGFITLAAALPTTVLAIVMLRQDLPNVIVLVSLIAAIALAAEIFAALGGETRARIMEGDLTYDHDGQDAVFQLELPLTAAPVGAGPDSL